MKRKLLSILLAVISCFSLIGLAACEINIDNGINSGNTNNNGGNTDNGGDPSDGENEQPPVYVTGITLNKTELTLKVEESEKLIATVLPDNATDKTVTWGSNKKSVATVSDGVVTAVGEGTAVITATAGNESAICTVTVEKEDEKPGGLEIVDHAGQLKLDFTSDTKKQEVTVRLFVEGDNTYFNPVANSQIEGCDNAEDFSSSNGYIKGRYIAVDTPAAVGKIEPWGKAAANFTRGKLENATSIIVESNDDMWNIDSTGERYLIWVWYLPEGGNEYRNLNIELLQEGLAHPANAFSRYAETAKAATEQAQAAKLRIFSDEQDPDFYNGDAVYTNLLSLRFNPEEYEWKKIVVEGLVTANFNNTAYIEEVFYGIDGYEDGIRIGMPVYYGYTLGKVVDEILAVGNFVKVIGVLRYFEAGGFYQITDIKPYDRYNPENNCEIIETVGLDGAYTEFDAAKFASDDLVRAEVSKTGADGDAYFDWVSIAYAETLLGTSVTLSKLTVKNVYTTQNGGGSSDGAMTLNCVDGDGTTVTLRTEVLRDKDGNLITADAYLGKEITVKGIIEVYVGKYQVRCYSADCITVLK